MKQHNAYGLYWLILLSPVEKIFGEHVSMKESEKSERKTLPNPWTISYKANILIKEFS